MLVGCWGAFCIFEVTRDKIYTFRDMNVSTEGRWQDHEIITELPKSEYLGPGISTISMTVDLIMELGVKPRKIVDNLRKYAREGRRALLIVGTEKIGENQWRLDRVEEAWDRIGMDGKLTKATVNLTFKEAP